MKKRILCMLLCCLLLLPVLAVRVRADTGPKPATRIKGLSGGGERIIVTLLAEEERYGPNDTIPPGTPAASAFSEAMAAAWDAFVNYTDPDGFHFWGQLWEYDVSWTYYPPEVFKVAVYYPEAEVLLVSSRSYERYAFRSDYRLVLPKLAEDAASGPVDMVLKKDTDWMEDTWELLCRIALTLLVELGLALVWRYFRAEQLRFLLRVNLLTQVGLNVLLWVWYYLDGPLNALLRLVLAELVVLVVETTLYLWKLPDRGKWWRTVSYALVANLASVILGFALLV